MRPSTQEILVGNSSIQPRTIEALHNRMMMIIVYDILIQPIYPGGKRECLPRESLPRYAFSQAIFIFPRKDTSSISPRWAVVRRLPNCSATPAYGGGAGRSIDTSAMLYSESLSPLSDSLDTSPFSRASPSMSITSKHFSWRQRCSAISPPHPPPG